MPGFREFKTFTAEDGERISIAAFDGIESHDRWRDHPDHRAAQRRGREEFYAEYRISVAEVLREHSSPPDPITDRHRADARCGLPVRRHGLRKSGRQPGIRHAAPRSAL